MPVFNQSRSYIVRLLFLVTFLVIAGQLLNLQVFSDKYQQLAENNAVFRKIVYPSRGIIYDRKDRAILANTITYDLMVTPSEVRGIDTMALCRLLEIDTAEFKARLINAIVRNGRYRPSPFEQLLTPQRSARLEENLWRFNQGFYLQERKLRTYPYNVGAHMIGYVGEVDSGIIARSNGFYLPGDLAGRSGIEAYYERILMGQRGVQFLIKDNRNRLVGAYENGAYDTAEVAGRGLRTYIDVELQQLSERLIKNKIGSIVALEPKTGGIISMVSGPDYNPNDLSGAAFRKNYGRMALDVSAPLLNRAIKGQYPAGSTYKPIEALIGLNEGVITPRSGIGCSGMYYGCNRPVNCTEKWGGHADNLREAIAHSCNSFFLQAYRQIVDNPKYGGVKNGYAAWKHYMNAFGYGQRLGVDLPSENTGNIPDTSVYNRVYRNSWNSCTNVTLGIGQDMMTVTPLQIANSMCIVANKGYYFTPHFVRSIDGETEADTILTPFRKKHEVLTHITDTAYETVISGMKDVTDVGTARYIPKIPGIDICAKTGTAENYRVLNGVRTKLKDHSIFACFAPRDNPKIAIAVIVENGGFGSTWAGPIAYLLIEKYLTDSLRADRLKEAERIEAANLLPDWLPREQYKADSARAQQWYKITKDSSYLRNFIKRSTQQPKPKKDSSGQKENPVVYQLFQNPMLPKKFQYLKRPANHA